MHRVGFLYLLVTITMVQSAAVVRRHNRYDVTDVASPKVSDMGLQVANVVTKFLSVLPIKEQLVTALSVPVARAYDTIRPGLKAIGFAYLAYQAMVYLLPTVVGGNVLSNVGTARSEDILKQHPGPSSKTLSEAIGELGVGAMAQSLQALNFTPRSTEILNIWEQECKRRAACELGKSLAERIPYVAWVLGYFGPKFPVIGPFADAFNQGLKRPDCSHLYQDCPYLRPTTNS